MKILRNLSCLKGMLYMAITCIDQPKLFHLTDGTHFSFVLKISKDPALGDTLHHIYWGNALADHAVSYLPCTDHIEINSFDEALQLDTMLDEAFSFDNFAWQRDNKISIDVPFRADGLHRILYKCPHCGSENQMEGKGIHLTCHGCKKQWEMDEYGRLHALNGETEFSHIPDWSNWERECVRKEIEDGTYYFEDDVKIFTLPSSIKFYKQGMGKLIQTPAETRIECNYYGKPYTLVRSAKHLESMHIEYDYLGRGDCVDISIPDDSFWCYLTKRNAITKISFATEEMHKLATKHRQT